MNPQDHRKTEETAAPLPVLGNASHEPQAQQPWAPPRKVLGITYKHDARAYLRCQANMFGREFVPLLLAGLIPMGVLTLLLLVGRTSLRSAANNFALILIAFSIWYLLGKISSVQSVLQRVGKNPNGLWLVALGAEGILSRADYVEVSWLKWREIKTIKYSGGDIYLFAKAFTGKFGYSGLAIPRSAFADTETAKRFYEMLVAVWKSKDDSAIREATDSGEFVVETS